MAAYQRSGDPLSPMVVFAPMLLYVYVYRPLVVLSSGSIKDFHPDREPLVLVHLINLCAVAAFCWGATWESRIRLSLQPGFGMTTGVLSRRASQQLLSLAIMMGGVALVVFWWLVFYSGGPIHVFSQRKPFFRSPIASGYFNELIVLTYPALLLLAASWHRQRLTFDRLLLVLVIASPQLMLATFAGRRGPAFLIAVTLVGCWCVMRSRRPTLRWTLAGLAVIGLILVLLGGNRKLFKPWTRDVDNTSLQDADSVSDVNAGDEYISASAVILAAQTHGTHYWGRRYFTKFVIRPIPRQLWPSKYEDLGMGWMKSEPGSAGFSGSQWEDAVGFKYVRGSAPGFVADLFLEFSWGAMIVCFCIGRFYSWAWKRWLTQGGFWTLLYLEMLVLSVYLPSQSVGAWLYRLMLLSAISWLAWRSVIGVSISRRRPLRYVGA